jgi:cyclophilin family peptidyl-prolyl cis-trans isomerase
MKEMNIRAFELLEKTQDTESLKGLLQVYDVTDVSPFIRYKLANLYMRGEKYDEAEKEYKYLVEKFKNHIVKEWANKRLPLLAINRSWKEIELEKKTSELILKRNLPRLSIKTNKGDFEVELYPDEAPNSVAKFIDLVKQGLWNQASVDEIKPDVGPCISISNTAVSPVDTTYLIPFERTALKHKEGVIGLLKPQNDDNSKSSLTKRFYICTSNSIPTDIGIDDKYTILGRVVKGLSTVKTLVKNDTFNVVEIKYPAPH